MKKKCRRVHLRVDDADGLAAGDHVVLLSLEYVGPNRRRRFFDERTLLLPLSRYPDGIPGNSNPAVCRFEGWRGTTNDWARHAGGAWRVSSVHGSRRNDYSSPDGEGGYEKMVDVELEFLKGDGDANGK